MSVQSLCRSKRGLRFSCAASAAHFFEYGGYIMRKTVQLIAAAVTIYLFISSCGSSVQTTPSSTESIISELTSTEILATEDNLFDTPAGFTDGFEKAEYDKFNSYARDNGLKDTFIWIEGVSGGTITIEADGMELYNTVITQDDGKQWLVGLDSDLLGSYDTFANIKDHVLCIRGLYQGFSDVYKLPHLNMTKMFDRTAGKMITSQSYREESTSNRKKVDEFSSATNQIISFGGASLEIPETWGEPVGDPEDNHIYFYPDGGMLMLSYTVYDQSTEMFGENEIKQYLDDMGESFESYELKAIEKTKLLSDGRDAYTAYLDVTIGTTNTMIYEYIICFDNTFWCAGYSDYPDTKYDRMDDLSKILYSIVVEDDGSIHNMPKTVTFKRTSQAIEPEPLYEDDDIRVTFGTATSSSITFVIENKLSEPIIIQGNSISINGYSTDDFIMSSHIAPNSRGEATALTDEFSGIGKPETVGGSLYSLIGDDWSTLARKNITFSNVSVLSTQLTHHRASIKVPSDKIMAVRYSVTDSNEVQVIPETTTSEFSTDSKGNRYVALEYDDTEGSRSGNVYLTWILEDDTEVQNDTFPISTML